MLRGIRTRKRVGGVPPADATRRPKVLHLAFEDHLRPNSGGGSRRTHEINRRLTGEFDITVVTARYPGCRSRVEDGVHYRHVGLASRSRFLSIIAYHASLPFAAIFAKKDIVIEDFASPVSSMAIALWTRKPTLAIVQWLFAGETSRQYRLPFFLFEALGVRTHRRFVAVSEWIADELRRRNPRADVTVIPNGLDAAELDQPVNEDRSRRLVYVGRYQTSAKGLDALLTAFELVADRCDLELHLYGGGPDDGELKVLAHASSHAARIHVHGWVDDVAKQTVMANAAMVAVPSRYETFGLVALEAMAAGAPVVGFEIPALVELVGTDCGVLAIPFEAEALASAILELANDPARARSMGRVGHERASGYDWVSAAKMHSGLLHSVLSGPPASLE